MKTPSFLLAMAMLLSPSAWATSDTYVSAFVQTVSNEVFPWLQSQGASHAEVVLQAANTDRVISLERVYESCNSTQNGREVQFCYSIQDGLFYVSRTQFPLNQIRTSAQFAEFSEGLMKVSSYASASAYSRSRGRGRSSASASAYSRSRRGRSSSAWASASASSSGGGAASASASASSD